MAGFGAIKALAFGLLLLTCRASYLAGIGLGDITGPVADVNLMGYAAPFQTAQGLHTRLYARAFMFAERPNPRRRFVYVSMDACMASQLVTLRVVQRLQAVYGDDLYGADNVAISGTHTHASPAGFLQYLLYDITSLGFVQATFDAMVDGVVTAIRAAHESLRPALLALASGDLETASVNRSPTAYLANPLEERDRYDTDVDTDMTLVRLMDASTGAGRGALGWFAVHCTSLNNTNRLVSGDNKAAAQLAMEWWAAEAEARAAAVEAAADGGAAAAIDGSSGRSASEVAAAAAAAAATAALGLDLGLVTSAGSRDPHADNERPDVRIHWLSPGGKAAGSADSSGRLGEDDGGGGGAPGLLRFEPGFVTAVAQGSVGDTSPNTLGAFCLDTGLPCDNATSTCNGRNEMCHGRGPLWPDDRASAAVIGARQFQGARRLYEAAEGQQAALSGGVDYRSTFLDMTDMQVRPSNWTRGGRTCPPAMGMSFAAGTTDGPGAFDFTQGDTRGPPLWRLVSRFVLPASRQQRSCQAPKPVLLDTGQATVPYLWQPRVTQISLLRLGRLIIACVPGEFTTMAGRRLKRALAERFAAAGAGAGSSGASSRPVVVISGLTGTYSSYVTTWEEYQVQRYEGASTLYGPHTLDAYIQEFLLLADAMIEARPVVSTVQPPDLEPHQISLLAPVVLDWVPPGTHFGELVEPPEGRYTPGQTASATFRAANPRNNLRTNRTFMAVEVLAAAGAAASWRRRALAPPSSQGDPPELHHLQVQQPHEEHHRHHLHGADGPCGTAGPGRAADAEWRVVYDDRDWVTRFHWHRPFKMSPESYASLSWDIPARTPSGTYRLHYYGDAKTLVGGIRPFEGCSPAFEVAAAAD